MGSVSAVLDGELYLGNAHASSDEALLRRLEIQRVVSVGCRTRALDGVRWFHVGVLDRGNQDITACLPEMAAFIEDGLSQGERVLVHCRAGICRSPALVAGFLAYSGRVPQISEALKLVRARRSIARIRPEFIAQLEERFPASEPNGGAGAAAASTGASGDRNGLRLIFLDIDGVLLPIVAGSHNQTFPDRCLSALSRVLDATGATIVLSSTWRVDTSAIDHITEEFKRFAREHAGPLGEVLGFQYMTDPQNHSVRQWEIAQWLASFDGRETWVSPCCFPRPRAVPASRTVSNDFFTPPPFSSRCSERVRFLAYRALSVCLVWRKVAWSPGSRSMTMSPSCRTCDMLTSFQGTPFLLIVQSVSRRRMPTPLFRFCCPAARGL